MDDKIDEKLDLGKGITADWLGKGKEEIDISPEMYKNNVFNNTLYEEYLPDIQRRTIGLVLNQ